MNAIDRIVTAELLETLEDARKGHSTAAERLSDSDRPELAPVFADFSRQRGRFVNDLERRALQRGIEPDVAGSPAGTLHRGWMAVADTLTGSKPEPVIAIALQGEHRAVAAYDRGLAQEISPDLRAMLERQRDEVADARDLVEDLANQDLANQDLTNQDLADRD